MPNRVKLLSVTKPTVAHFPAKYLPATQLSIVHYQLSIVNYFMASPAGQAVRYYLLFSKKKTKG